MTLKINGATGGSVSLDAPDNTSPAGTDVTLTLPVNDGDAGQYLQTDGTGTLSWQTNVSFPDASDVNASAPADSVNIDSAGHVGLGTTSPDDLLHLSASNSGIGSDLTLANNIIRFEDTDVTQATSQTIGGFVFEGQDIDTNAAGIQAALTANVASGTGGGEFRFYVAPPSASSPTEQLKLSNDGALKVGNTTNDGILSGTPTYKLTIGQASNNGGHDSGCVQVRSTGNSGRSSFISNTVYNNHVLFYWRESAAGSITSPNSASVAYNTSSDYRLKENVVPLTGAIDRVNQLQVHRFNFIVDPDKTVDGFMAHEAQTVVPECATGFKDEVEVWQEGETLPDGVSVGDNKLDENGNTIPVYQGIDQSKLVPLLTAALQEAIAKIETLETRITALEGGAA